MTRQSPKRRFSPTPQQCHAFLEKKDPHFPSRCCRAFCPIWSICFYESCCSANLLVAYLIFVLVEAITVCIFTCIWGERTEADAVSGESHVIWWQSSVKYFWAHWIQWCQAFISVMIFNFRCWFPFPLLSNPIWAIYHEYRFGEPRVSKPIRVVGVQVTT